MARLVAALGRNLEPFYDDVDLVVAAAAAAPGAESTGPVVVYLPGRLRPVDLSLLEALEAAVPVTVVVGATGDPDADLPAKALVQRLGGRPADHGAFDGPVERGSWVHQAPTADAEVLTAVRHLMARNVAGARLERMALVHNGVAPYPRLLHDVLTGAGIPFNGAGIRPLAATVAGRALLGALELPDHDWRRDEVVAWVSSAPILHGRRAVPASSWDDLSCEAGVVRGLAEWRRRPADHAAVLRDLAERDDERRRRFEREADECEAMAGFVASLAERLAEPSGTWVEWSRWAGKLLGDLLGGPAQTATWPGAELAALEAVKLAVDGLAALGGGRPGPGAFRSALAAELEATAPPVSRFGHGVMVGQVGEIAGLDLDVVWVVGMIDGAFPGRPADDVLVPDAVREPCGLPLRGSRAAESRRDYLAALAAGTERVLSFATGNQRQGNPQRPARLLLDTLGAPAGTPLYAGDLEHLEPSEGYRSTPSFAAAVADGSGDPVSPADWDLRSLLLWTQAGHHPADHFAVDGVMAAGFELQRGRRAPRFTRYDGRIDGAAPTSPADPSGRVQSATGLESYASCPRRYLFSNLLGVEVRTPPEAVLRIDARERGHLVHRVLERFVAEELARPEGERIAPSQPWGPAGRERMDRIADEEFDEYERRGLTGRPVLWSVDRSVIRGQLRHFLREDDRYRAEHLAVPASVEESFGRGGAEPLAVGLPDGRQVRFRGTVDRIDRTAGGGLSVLDYKTGGHKKEEDDPFQGGTRLQLALYGQAARRRHPATGPVEVRYWYVSDGAAKRGRYLQEGFTLDDRRQRQFSELVGKLVEGIEGGRFPGNPDGCARCDFTHVCPPDRARSWDHKAADPWVADYRELAEPT